MRKFLRPGISVLLTHKAILTSMKKGKTTKKGEEEGSSLGRKKADFYTTAMTQMSNFSSFS